MADSEDIDTPVEEQAKTAEEKKQQAALGKLGDGDATKEVNTEKAKEAMNALTTKSKQLDEAKEARRKALLSVKVEAADVELIVDELEVAREVAELALRENNGVVVAAIRSLVH